jgi:hypothetical protein
MGGNPHTIIYVVWGKNIWIKELIVNDSDILVIDYGKESLNDNIIAINLINSGTLFAIDEYH